MVISITQNTIQDYFITDDECFYVFIHIHGQDEFSLFF